jgi:hypothetical protein
VSRVIEKMSVMMPHSVVDWAKHRDQYLMSPTGRWGWRWLWSLVFRMAINLGMVTYHRSRCDGVRVCSIDIQGKSNVEMISNAMLPYLNAGLGPSDLIVLMGSPEWPGLAYELHDSMRMQFGFPVGHKESRHPSDTRAVVYDMPIVVTPHIKGCLVLPRRLFECPK